MTVCSRNDCPKCHGYGGKVDLEAWTGDGIADLIPTEDCDLCKGTGNDPSTNEAKKDGANRDADPIILQDEELGDATFYDEAECADCRETGPPHDLTEPGPCRYEAGKVPE